MNKITGVKYFIIVFLLSWFACKTPEEITKVKLEHYSTKELLDFIDQSTFDFNSLSAKAEIDVVDEKTTSFKVHIRIQKDSAIWVSITPLLGIEMARALITQDSIIFMNRVKSEYFKGDFSYINKTFNVDLDYDMLQALLVGNSIDFEKNEKVRTSIDRKKDLYFIGTEKKRKIKKDLKKDLKKDKEKIKEQTQIIWLSPENMKIAELLLHDPERDQSLHSTFSDYQAIDEQLFPHKLQFNIEAKRNLTINVNYNKVTLNKELSFSFKIPSKYEQVQ